MEDKAIKEMQEWANNAQGIFDNFSNFVNESMKDLTPKEKEIVDKEMEKLNDQDLKDNIDNLNKTIKEQMAKFKF